MLRMFFAVASVVISIAYAVVEFVDGGVGADVLMAISLTISALVILGSLTVVLKGK